MSTFAYIVRPNHAAASARVAQAETELMAAHFNYLKTLNQMERLNLAGLCQDGAFGLVIFEADNMEEADRVMREDPIVAAGAMAGSCHPFQIVLQG